MRTTIQFNTSGDSVNTAFPALLKAASHVFTENVRVTGLLLSAEVRAAAATAVVHVNALEGKADNAAASGNAPLMPGLSFWENGKGEIPLYFADGIPFNEGQAISLYVAAPNSASVKVTGLLTIYYEARR